MALNLNFSPQLVRDLTLEKLALVKHLKRDDELALLLASQVDVAKLTPT